MDGCDAYGGDGVGARVVAVIHVGLADADGVGADGVGADVPNMGRNTDGVTGPRRCVAAGVTMVVGAGILMTPGVGVITAVGTGVAGAGGT